MGKLGERGRYSERVIQCGTEVGAGGGVVCADCLDLLPAVATIMISFGRRRVRRRLARHGARRRELQLLRDRGRRTTQQNRQVCVDRATRTGGLCTTCLYLKTFW